MDVKKLKKLLSNYKYYDIWIAGKQQELAEVEEQLHLAAKGNGSVLTSELLAGDSLAELANAKEWLELHINQLGQSKIFINKILNKLSDTDRDIIQLYYIEGKSWTVVADEVGYSIISCQRHRDDVFEKILAPYTT